MIGELAALGAAFCWAVSAALYKMALSDAKPVSANISRCIFTTIFLMFCLGFTGRFQDLTALQAHPLFLAGLSGIVGLGFGDTLYMWSLRLIGVSRAVPITCTYPLFTMFFASLLFRERVTFSLLLGALSIVVGIWLVTREKDRLSGEMRGTLLKGVFIALATAIIWSVSITSMNEALRLSQQNSLSTAMVINTVRMLTVTSLLLILSPIVDRKFGFLKMKSKTWFLLALGGIIALGLGWILLAISLLHIPASVAVPISSISPLFATAFGTIILKEKVTVQIFAGSILIVLGVSALFLV